MWDGQDTKNSLIPAQHALPPIVTGVADALIERVSDLPQLALMIGGLIINHDHQQEALAGLFTPQGWQALQEGIFAELVDIRERPEKQEHVVATASVNLVLGFYALLSYGPRAIAQLMDKIEAVAKRVDQAPHLARYLKKIVQDAPSEQLAKKLEQLLDNLDAAVLERLLGRLPEDKLDDLVTDLADNRALRDALAKNEGLVDSWRILDDANVPAVLKRDPVRLGQVDNYLKKNPRTESAITKGLDDVEDYKEEFFNGIKNATDDLSGVNGRSALPDEISDAVIRIKQHRTDISKPHGKNYGYLEGDVNGSAVDNKIWSSGEAKPDVEPQIFDAIEVEGSSGHSWLRNTDSEYKMLNQLADDLGGVKGQTYLNVNGTLKIVSENPYCASCQGVIQQFNEMYPNINLILVDGVR